MTIPRERYKRVAELHRSGMSLAAIGRELGVCRERVRQMLAKWDHLKWRELHPKPLVFYESVNVGEYMRNGVTVAGIIASLEFISV